MKNNYANDAGQGAEYAAEAVLKILESKGYLCRRQKRLKCEVLPIFNNGDTLIVDLYFEGLPYAPSGMALSVKIQDSEGTADTKLHCEVLHTIKECSPVPVILVVVGEHWRKQSKQRAVSWIKSQVDQAKFYRAIFSFDDLYAWAMSVPKCTGIKSKQRINPHGLMEHIIASQSEMF